MKEILRRTAQVSTLIIGVVLMGKGAYDTFDFTKKLLGIGTPNITSQHLDNINYQLSQDSNQGHRALIEFILGATLEAGLVARAALSRPDITTEPPTYRPRLYRIK